ncbi:MAG: hypothetical protein KBG47_02895 [Bacteroidia bacterium]|nr:hypothetical protein [Sphingobacteriaceae bacterium]MBP9068426.1 hypothetical protein [Bacteroidia bacterium]
MKQFTLALLIAVFAAQPISAQTDSTKKKSKFFELSFGQSLLFIPNSQLDSIRKNSSIIVPTSAILFLAELRPNKNVRIPLFFNLPLETKQYLVNGELVNEKASVTFGTGVQFKVFQIKIDSNSRIEFEAGPLASFIFNKRNDIVLAPVLAGRFRIVQGETFTMYLGCSYSMGIKAFGILYGTGSVF